MNTLQVRTFIVLMMMGLGANTAWSGQNSSTTAATESHATMLKGATARSDRSDRDANKALPGIMNEEDIPAFLRTDPCDTGDS